MPKVVTEILKVHQAIDNLVAMMADIGQVGGQPQVAAAALFTPWQVQILPLVGRDVRIQDFLKLNPLPSQGISCWRILNYS